MYSLRRTLAVRFSLTMLVALVLVGLWAWLGLHSAVQGLAPSEHLIPLNRTLLIILVGVVIMGTVATAIGAFWLARRAVQPVLEVVEQARGITPGQPHLRITAHADVVEYESLVHVLNGLLERCERAFTAQRRLTADMGHELKTPLAAMQGEFEVALRATRTPQDYQLALRSGLEEVSRLTTMCDALLLITRVEGQSLIPHLAPTDLSVVAERALESRRRTFEEKGITATASFQFANGVPADEPLIERLVGTLLDNAIRFSPIGGTLSVGTVPTGTGARLWVEDSGPGIPADVLPHLFEPFYRADPARTRGDGAGLGLTVAESIARLHHGTIRAENLPAGGARFVLDLPTGAAN